MKIHTFRFVPLVIIAFCSSQLSFAENSDYERESLAGIRHELKYLKEMVAGTQRDKVDSSSFAFRYGDLESDLSAMISGIDEYLNAPSTKPREIEPLKQEYIQ